MIKEYTHYGEKVTRIWNSCCYEYILEKKGVNYEPLPIIAKEYRVLRYNDKYAICVPSGYESDEMVLIIDEFPVDLDLQALIDDIKAQEYHKSEPKIKRSKASILIKMADDSISKRKSFDDMLSGENVLNGKEFTDEEYFYEIRMYLAFYGGITYLKTLPHDDVDEEFWRKLIQK